mmetsp:Transcript_1311/g.2348  ORF Transcript_1311/g.2348 Transcript_1311/m.2348 type:complete len:235 (-) Transcript_1311:2439-3143(-)
MKHQVNTIVIRPSEIQLSVTVNAIDCELRSCPNAKCLNNESCLPKGDAARHSSLIERHPVRPLGRVRFYQIPAEGAERCGVGVLEGEFGNLEVGVEGHDRLVCEVEVHITIKVAGDELVPDMNENVSVTEDVVTRSNDLLCMSIEFKHKSRKVSRQELCCRGVPVEGDVRLYIEEDALHKGSHLVRHAHDCPHSKRQPHVLWKCREGEVGKEQRFNFIVGQNECRRGGGRGRLS